MNLSLLEFCEAIKGLQKSNAEKAMALLWYHDRQQPNLAMSSGRLTRIMIDHHLGTPNATQLRGAIRDTKLAHACKAGFSLKAGSRSIIESWLPHDIHGLQPRMDHSAGYLAETIWIDTNRYVEGVCLQLNGCYKAAYYDAASVMLRRLAETLIIEAYEAIGRRNEILDSMGNPHLLDQLINCATSLTPPGGKGLSIGREAKGGLSVIKKLGNRSAHNRRVLANRSDLDDIRSGARTAVEELITIANLKNLL